MILADMPAVLLGDKVVKLVPIPWVNRIGALFFVLLGITLLLGLGR